MSDSSEGTIEFTEAIAMKLFPDHHAHPMLVYVGDKKTTFSAEGWKSLYAEMMSKPTNMPKEEWHERFVNQKKAR